MIDLHIHTTSSDGSDEPKDILIRAQQKGLKYISITDHDSIDAYEKLEKINVSDYYTGEIIPGCEFSAVHKGKPVEVLAYGINLDTISSSGVISDDKFLERENEYLNKMMIVCENLNLTYSDDLSIKNSRYFATQVMHSDLQKYPENKKFFTNEIWENVNAFYRTCVNNENNPFFLNQIENYPSIQDVVDIIKRAGGKAFLAHLYAYYVEDYNKFLKSIISLNLLDGIECYHSLHTMDKTRNLLNYCDQYNLFASGGSDYHGYIKPNVKLGECIHGIKIPFEILKPWFTSSMRL